jgi:hypothetical protein
MIRYKDNQELKLKTVKTVTGDTEYRRNCRKIRDKYYVKGEQCFIIDDKWYAYTSKLITLDYEKNIYVILKDTPLVYGVVDFKKDGVPIFGYFTENKYNNIWVTIPNYGAVKVYKQEVLEKNDFVENLSDATWVYSKTLTPQAITKLGRIEGRRVYKDKGYNIEDNKEEFGEKIKMFDTYPLKVSPNAVRYARFLGNTSFGLEIETALGIVPDHILYRTGVVICRDGSIDNGEYVTVPLRGAKGLQNIKNLSEEMMKRTTSDLRCSFHIHLGTLPDDRLFLTALYALGIRIQDEIFTMFPYYKTDWKGVKKQAYNQKLRKLGIGTLKNSSKEEFKAYVDDAYYRLFKWLNDGQEPDDRFNRTNHAHTQNAKWNRKQRYYWMNFMNMFFSDRKTIEFRLHQNTLNHHKMIPWLFICHAIVRYAEKHAKEILQSGEPIVVSTILDFYKDQHKTESAKFLSNYLKAYYNNRVEYFQNDLKNGDVVSQKEVDFDKKFTFTHEGKTGLI